MGDVVVSSPSGNIKKKISARSHLGKGLGEVCDILGGEIFSKKKEKI